MFLAEVTDTVLGSWVNVAILAGGFVANLVTIWAVTRPKPALHETYATKTELREVKEDAAEEMQLLHERLSGLRKDLATAGDARADKILQAVGDLSKTVREDIGGVHKRITAAERDITRVDERTKPRA